MRRLLVVAAVLVAALLVYLLSRDGVARSERPRAGHRAEERREAPPAESGVDSITVSPLVPSLESRRAGVDLDRDVCGVVVEKNGPPIAGAEVTAVWYPWRRTGLLNLEGRDEVAFGPTTRTAADGWFKLPLERGQEVALRVRAEGFAPVEVQPYLAGEYVKVEMTRGARLLVRALDDKENPLPGAKLRLFPQARTGPWWFEKEGVTGEDGRYTFAGIPVGATAWLEPKHETWGHPSWGWLEVKFPDESDVVMEFAMRPGRTVTGTVTDKETGRPIAGARVGAGWTMRRATTTDENGRYEMHGWVGEGVHEIHVHAKGYAPDNVNVGSKEVVDFALARGTAVKARVVDVTGRPLAGVMVGVIGSVHDGNKQIVSDGYATAGEDGRLEIGNLRTDLKHTVVLLKRGYGRTLRDFDPVPATDAPLDLGDIVLPDALSIEGFVLAADGTVLPRTPMTLVVAGDERGDRILYGNSEERVTDHLGRFRFPDLAPGTYTLHVRREGATRIEKEVNLVDVDRRDVEIRFPGGRGFVVLVVDDAGAPVEGAFIFVQHEKGHVQGTTDAEGRAVFEVEGRVLRVDPRMSVASKERYLRGEPLTDIPAGQGEVRVVLKRAAEVSGKVVDPDGKPVATALLEARRGGERVASGQTNGAGQFTLAVPRDGTTDIVLTGLQRDLGGGRIGYDLEPPWHGELKGVSPGSKGLVMQTVGIPADRTLVVRVVDPAGAPVRGVHVIVVPGPRDRKQVPTTDENGVARFGSLLARETRVSLRLPADVDFAVPLPVTVVPDGQTLEIALRPAVVLAGTIVDGEAKPIARAFVLVIDGDTSIGSSTTDADGRFAVRIPADLGRPVTLRYGVVGGQSGWRDRENVDPAAGELTLVIE